MTRLLSQRDVRSIFSVLNTTYLLRISFLESLSCRTFCFSGLCSRSRRKERLREIVSQSFEEKLDVRSFVSVHKNLALLMSLLLTPE